jgi:hypothetical protein
MKFPIESIAKNERPSSHASSKQVSSPSHPRRRLAELQSKLTSLSLARSHQRESLIYPFSRST